MSVKSIEDFNMKRSTTSLAVTVKNKLCCYNFQLFKFLYIFLSFELVGTVAPVDSLSSTKGLFDEPSCFLTLNEVAGKGPNNQIVGRELELNWCNIKATNGGDWIGLFDHDPATDPPGTDPRQRALRSYSVENFFLLCGYIKTDIRLPPMKYTPSPADLGEDCQQYWIGYFHRDASSGPIVSNCFRMHPRWMTKRASIIGNLPLTSLMIPGTHDTGAWKVYDGHNDNVVTKYAYAQEESPYNQMISGIRYFDVRPAYYPGDPDDKFWINHGTFKIVTLEAFLDDAKQFVQEFNEVIIMDFHEFPVGFTTNSEHETLYRFVKEKIGDLMAPRMNPREATLNKLWALKKTIILSYNYGIYNTKPDLWRPVIQAWGDKNTVEHLHQYLPQAIAKYGCSDKLWAAMAELTPTTWDVIRRPNYGLRRMANDVNKPLESWYKDPAWYSKSNIVATDFYLGNDLMEVCMKVNENRVICDSNSVY